MLGPELVDALAEMLGAGGIARTDAARVVYECDAFTEETELPELVLLPGAPEEAAALLRVLRDVGVSVVPRGAGTGQSGGCLPRGAAVVLCTSRLNCMEGVDVVNRRALIEAGTSSSRLGRAAAACGLFYPPGALGCGGATVGGSIARNAGGRHAARYGGAAAHVLAVDLALGDGEVLPLGGPMEDVPGYDLLAVVAGSEGTVGVVTRAIVRLRDAPQARLVLLAAFASAVEAAEAATGLVRAGVDAAAMDILDAVMLDALRAAGRAVCPERAAGLLLVELHGRTAGLDEHRERTVSVLRTSGALDVRIAGEDREEGPGEVVAHAVGALGRLTPDVSAHEGVVPRGQIPAALRRIAALGECHGLRIANAVRAGDGLVRAFLCHDAANREEVLRTRIAAAEFAETCVDLGGGIVGDQGIGMRKVDSTMLVFSPEELDLLKRLRGAFDAYGVCNPGKLLAPAPDARGATALRADAGGAVIPRPSRPPEPYGAAEVRSLLGTAAVGDAEALWRYACNGLPPKCVVYPRSVEEAQAVVRLASERALAVVPCGSATELGIGFRPQRYDVALSTRDLTGPILHEPGDATVVVPAGVTVGALNRHLAAAGQWLPLDPAHPEEVTVGGLVAADRNGPARLTHGKVRDWLLGLRVVAADGSLVSAGGVGGRKGAYDLAKLFVGSFGTLGLIVEAAFRLQPLPACERVFVWPAPSIGEALSRALEIRDPALAPLFLEAVNAPAAELIGAGERAALLIGVAGSERDVDAVEALLSRRVSEAQRVGDTDRRAVCRALRDFPQPLSEDALVARVSTEPAQLAPLLERFEMEARARGVTVEMAAHAASGVAWCQVAGPLSVLQFELCAEWIRVHAREQNAWAVFEALPPGLQGRVDPWGFSDPTLPLMHRVKQALDPQGVFSPGRFVGGI